MKKLFSNLFNIKRTKTQEELNRQGLLLALHKDELYIFLAGGGIYMLGYNVYSPVNNMLNLAPSMAAIYSYYKDEPEERIDLILEKQVLRWLALKSCYGVYAAFSFLSYQLKMEQKNKSPFKLNTQKIMPEFKKQFESLREDLKKTKEYEGESLEEGLFEAMKNENEVNIENYGIKIF